MIEKFNHLDIIKATATKTHLPPDTVRMVVEAFLDTMKEGLLEKNLIVLRDFGTIRPRLREHPKLGRLVVVTFRTARSLQDALRKKLT